VAKYITQNDNNSSAVAEVINIFFWTNCKKVLKNSNYML
jgi:hypothetical protein